MTDAGNDFFGQLILQTGLVTQEELDSQLALQEEYRAQGKKVPRLGELMARNGILTVNQVKTLLREQRTQLSLSSEPIPAEDSVEPSPEEIPDSRNSFRFQRGAKVFDNYEIKSQLGETSRCVTYKALDRATDEIVLLQVVRNRAMLDSEYMQAFHRSIQRAGRLNHPNLLRVLASGKVNDQLYYVSEFCRGASLRRLLLKNKTVSQEMAVRIGIAVAAALEHGHAVGIIHQEISPSSIIVSNEGEIKLAGFGRVSEPIRDLQALLARAGDTPFYVAPEQVAGKGKKEADARTDLYSLGAALYHIIAGQPPYSGENIESLLMQMADHEHPPLTLLVPEMNDQLAVVIEKLLHADPAKRYQSASEVSQALKAVETSMGLAAMSKTALAEVAMTAAVAGRNTSLPERKPPVPAVSRERKTGTVKRKTSLLERPEENREGRANASVISGGRWWALGGAVLVILVIAVLFAYSAGSRKEETGKSPPAVKVPGVSGTKQPVKREPVPSVVPVAETNKKEAVLPAGAPPAPAEVSTTGGGKEAPLTMAETQSKEDLELEKKLKLWKSGRDATEERLRRIDLGDRESFAPEEIQ